MNVIFTWNFNGESVELIGSFSDWDKRFPMQKIGNEFTVILQLARCVHQYKFIVDGEWRFAPDQQTCQDDAGNMNNFIDSTNFKEQRPEPVQQAKTPNQIVGNQYTTELPNFSDFNAEASAMSNHMAYNILNGKD